MELVDNIQEQQSFKFPRINGNGRNNNTNNSIFNLDSNNKIVPIKGVFLHDNNNHHHHHHNNHNYPDEEEDHPKLLKCGSTGVVVAGPAATDSMSNINLLRGWNSSRIIRVSRASGGKDRHSKVLTSKGLRDRRVRLSVSTAIQFYDLQDRLGYDQPSKAVEWLIKAASDAINELPSLNTNFPDTPKQLSSEKRGANEEDQDQNHQHEHVNNNNFDSIDQFDQISNEANNFQQNQQQQQNLSKSACSSTSDTSKGSGLSLSRSEIRVNRVKARERARERAAKEKDKDQNDNSLLENVHHVQANHPNLTHQNSASSSFTELLIGPNSTNSAANSRQTHNHNNHHQWHLSPHHVAMDYFNNSGQTHLGIGASSPLFTIPFNHGEMQQQHFSFVNPHDQQVEHDYNLNFTIASSSSSSSSPSAPGLAAGIFNRGTLQSNISPSLNLPHFQRLISSPIEGSSSSSTTNVPSFFIGATPPPPPPSMESSRHPHHFSSPAAAAFDAHLQLRYGDGTTPSNQKGEGKN